MVKKLHFIVQDLILYLSPFLRLKSRNLQLLVQLLQFQVLNLAVVFLLRGNFALQIVLLSLRPLALIFSRYPVKFLPHPLVFLYLSLVPCRLLLACSLGCILRRNIVPRLVPCSCATIRTTRAIHSVRLQILAINLHNALVFCHQLA